MRDRNHGGQVSLPRVHVGRAKYATGVLDSRSSSMGLMVLHFFPTGEHFPVCNSFRHVYNLHAYDQQSQISTYTHEQQCSCEGRVPPDFLDK